MKIAVAGTGYVGLSLAVLLSQRNEVKAVDILPDKVEKINHRISPIQDEYIEKFLREDREGKRKLDLQATLDGASAYKDADFVIISTPTNYDNKRDFFDTSAVEQVIEAVLANNRDAIMVIKSTVPSAIQNIYERFTRHRISCSHRNFFARVKHFTTIFILPELLLEQIFLMNGMSKPHRRLQICSRKGLSKIIFRNYIWALRRRKR